MCNSKMKQFYRKQNDIKKFQHEYIENYIILLESKIYIEAIKF